MLLEAALSNKNKKQCCQINGKFFMVLTFA